MTFEWADAHVNLIGHARSEVPETTRRPALRDALPPRHPHPGPDAAERSGRDRGGARRASSSTDEAEADAIRAFRIEPLESLVLHQGTWHWGPFPIEGPEVRLFNVQGLRYAEDNRCVDLAAKGLSVEVDLS